MEPKESLETHPSVTRSSLKKALLFSGCFLIVAVVAMIGSLWLLNQPADNFPLNQPIVIEPGSSMLSITEDLADMNVVRSKRLLYILLILFHEPNELKASTYEFNRSLTTLEIADRITTGEFTNDLLKVTLVEGERAELFAKRTAPSIPDFDAATFIALATPYEGMLWPETYFIPPVFTEAELVTLLRTTYQENIQTIQPQIAAHPLSEQEVITLASIVEREANSPASMKMVAGILLNRLEIGMALQADATIEYVLDTPLNELPPGQLATELRETDSPYNSYLYPGLPPTPIGNPGIVAITAVLEPTPSEYFYYITGRDGNFYYAETLSEHNLNIARHLR